MKAYQLLRRDKKAPQLFEDIGGANKSAPN